VVTPTPETSDDGNLSIVDRKRLHTNVVWKQNKAVAKKVKLEQSHVVEGQDPPNFFITMNMDGCPMILE
jgi:hypothetical protein